MTKLNWRNYLGHTLTPEPRTPIDKRLRRSRGHTDAPVPPSTCKALDRGAYAEIHLSLLPGNTDTLESQLADLQA